MSAIRSEGTGPEIRVADILRRLRVRHTAHPRIEGKPDFLAAGRAVFVDGCFWHCCPEHFRMPKTNRKFWEKKFSRNRARDVEVNQVLRSSGIGVTRIWEHEVSQRGFPEKLRRLLNEKVNGGRVAVL